MPFHGYCVTHYDGRRQQRAEVAQRLGQFSKIELEATDLHSHLLPPT
ncbi:MAG: hypothetical protein ACLFVU_14880 [Phycisphaerae bacterium]